MPFLEAMACGLPVIVTGWGGHLDFLDEQNAILVRHQLKRAGEIQYDCQDVAAKIADPDKDDLAAKMRRIYEGKLFRRPADPGMLARYTWSEIARRLMAFLAVPTVCTEFLPG